MKFVKKPLQITISLLFAITVTACADLAETLGIKINADNAEEITRNALDMAEAGDLAESVVDAVLGTNTIDEVVNCNAPLLGTTNASGSATVTGTIANSTKDLSITYSDCAMNNYVINGSFNLMSSTTGDIKTKTITGNLTVTYNGDSFTLSNYSMVDTRNTVTDDYSEDFGLVIAVPLIGNITIDTTTPFSGNKSNNPDKPVSGELVVTGPGNSKVKLTVIDNASGYNLDLDSDADDVYDTQITDVTGSLIFAW